MQAGQSFECVQSLRGEKAAGSHFDRAVEPAQRKQFFFEQNTGGEKREKLAVGLDILERGVTQTVLAGQPPKNVFFGGRPAARTHWPLLGQMLGIDGGQLPGGNHLIEQ